MEPNTIQETPNGVLVCDARGTVHFVGTMLDALRIVPFLDAEETLVAQEHWA